MDDIFVSLFSYVNSEDIELIAYKNAIDSQCETNDSKVKFEGVDVVVGEDAEEIATAFNESNDFTKLIIQLDNSFDNSLERPEDMTMTGAKELLRQQRANVKEYYTRTNAEISENLNLDALDINYKVDSYRYSPFIFRQLIGHYFCCS